MKKLLIVLLLTVITLPVFAQSQEEIEKYMELTRSDLRSQKVQLITAAMEFSVEESAAFWPVYNKYQDDLKKIGDQRWALIKDYADHYATLDDAKAGELTQKALDLESQRIDLMKKYVPKFGKVLSAKRVARLVQVENQINRLIDIQLGSEIPLVPGK